MSGPTSKKWWPISRHDLTEIRWLRAGLLLSLLLICAPAMAVLTLDDEQSRHELHQHRSGLWLDSWTPVREQDWPEGISQVPNRGWSEDIYHWYSTISNESSQTTWYLLIRNPSLDLIRVYLDLPDSDHYIQLSDYQSPAQRLSPGNHFVIPLRIEPGTRQSIYITGTSDDWQFFPMMLMDRAGYQTFTQQEMLLVGAVTGLLLALFLFNLLQTLLKGHWSFVWVAISAMAWLLQLWFWFGLGHLWLWPDSPWIQNNLWYLLVPLTGLSLLGSVIAALGAFLKRSQKHRLYSGAIAGFAILVTLYLMVSPALFLLLTWLWYSALATLILLQLRHTQALYTLHLLLFGYSALGGVWLAYMSFSPVLHTPLLALFSMAFLLLTALHSFVIYWQFHRNQQKAWADLRARSQAYADVADEHREQLDQIRAAAQLGQNWRGALNANIESRLHQVHHAVKSLRHEVQADARQMALDSARQATRDGLNYVQDLQNLEQLLTQNYEVEADVLDLRTWLTGFEDWFDDQEDRHQGRVYFRAELMTPDVPLLVGPDRTLQIILLRLLDNALEYTESGFIKLIVEAEGQTRHRVNTRFELRDSGQGMEDELLAEIKRFWLEGTPPPETDEQGHPSVSLGSGLTIALFLLRRLGARLQVQSTPDAGTSVCFWLWMDIEQDAQGQKAVEHWLIVDESPVLYQEARTQLLNGVDIYWVKNGQIGLSRLREQTFDVILLDLQAQLVDGIEFTRACRAREDGNRYAWIIGLAPDDRGKLSQHARQAGVNEVIVRPRSDAELRAWIRLLIKRMFRGSDQVK